ncbi:DUF305 domain-containing protein [Actinomadura sp. WAC 06369]|uniref:DUF305 domain-containing protein n=1 Tax=Actinomadura sp. WAC 06369 TaxID=2203193 RepID=UPI000F793C0A|nr:DUF305 domain-containing protein [Actinomadura sp. WAC 06369]RSN64564.1 DUF305 domain-containing protein [Actinomadura sp. WAC 06369]
MTPGDDDGRAGPDDVPSGAADGTDGVPSGGASGGGRGRRVTVVLAVAVLVGAVALAGLAALRSGRPGTDGPEAGFARDMSVHHAQAVQMSFIVRDRTGDADVRLLAYDIANTQSQQIGMMTAWLDEWELPKADPGGRMRWMAGHGGHGGGSAPGSGASGRMPGMATPEQLAELERASGRDAEVLYLRLMTTHHRAGVEMAEAVLGLTGHERVRRLARTMVRGQQSEISLMEGMLRERGASPAGGPG